MKLKLFILLSLSFCLFSCSKIEELLEEEEEVNKQIENLEGEWKLISINDSPPGQALFIDEDFQINDCEEPMICEFITSSDRYKGNYIGDVNFWVEELDSCNPETFEGLWKWNNDTELLFLDINSTSSNNTYSNNFTVKYYLGVDDDDLDVDVITFSFTNDNGESQITYIFEKI